MARHRHEVDGYAAAARASGWSGGAGWGWGAGGDGSGGGGGAPLQSTPIRYAVCESIVIDAEAEAIDRETNTILPFQKLMDRKNKDVVKLEDVKVTVRVCAFDIVYYNGVPLLEKPLQERREILAKVCEKIPNKFELSSSVMVSRECNGSGWFGENEILTFSHEHFPVHRAFGGGGDSDSPLSWVPCVEETLGGKKYRRFVAGVCGFTHYDHILFPSDGGKTLWAANKRTREHTYGSPGYAVVFSKRSGQNRQGGTETPAEMGVHTAVALLWGAQKRTRLPMSTLLVVDHIDPAAPWSNDIKNLQFLTIAQNSMKGNGRNRTEWTGYIANDGSAIGWYGESSYASYAKLAQESWVRFREVTRGGVAYRSFVPSDEEFGGLSKLFFPRNGGEILRYKGGTFERANQSYTTKGYPTVISGNDKPYKAFLVHKAVALLWGAPKRTAHAMYHSALCVDHWDGDKLNYSVDNLQWLTNRQNTLKGKNVGVADHRNWVPSHWWPLTGSPT